MESPGQMVNQYAVLPTHMLFLTILLLLATKEQTFYRAELAHYRQLIATIVNILAVIFLFSKSTNS